MGQMRDEKKLAVGSCQGADESGQWAVVRVQQLMIELNIQLTTHN